MSPVISHSLLEMVAHVLNLMTPICLSQSMSIHTVHMTFIMVMSLKERRRHAHVK